MTGQAPSPLVTSTACGCVACPLVPVFVAFLLYSALSASMYTLRYSQRAGAGVCNVWLVLHMHSHTLNRPAGQLGVSCIVVLCGLLTWFSS